MDLRQLIFPANRKSIASLRHLARKFAIAAKSPIKTLMRKRTFSSEAYWNYRYVNGGNSGPGSYQHLAKFKAEALNKFVSAHQIRSVMEFGCGDGNQLLLAQYPRYTGYDISPTAIELCTNKFRDDPNKEFFALKHYDGRTADLAISLDVLFHLTEDSVFEDYMRRLFDSANQYIAIYSSNFDEPPTQQSPHVRHRNFTSWILKNAPETWELYRHTPNLFPYNGDSNETSFCEFYFYKKSEKKS